MRSFGFVLGQKANLHAPSAPPSRLSERDPSLPRRRLVDSLEAIFLRTCAMRDFDAAADVLAVLEKWHQRQASAHGRDRRAHGREIQRLRAEFERLRARHSGHP